MPEDTLILKRDPNARYTESYNILFEGRHVGRIYKAVSHAPREAPWFWGLDFFEWQGTDRPQYGNAATLEAAKQAFRACGIAGLHIKNETAEPGEGLGGLAHLDKGPGSGGWSVPLSIDTNLKPGTLGPLLSLRAVPLAPWDNSARAIRR